MQRDRRDKAPVLPLKNQGVIFRAIRNQDSCENIIIFILYIDRITCNIGENGRKTVRSADLSHSISRKKPEQQCPHYDEPGGPGNASQPPLALMLVECCLITTPRA